MKTSAAKQVLFYGLMLLCLPGCVLTSPLRTAIFPESVTAPASPRATLAGPVVVQAQAEVPAADSKTLSEQTLVDLVLRAIRRWRK